MPTYEYQCNNCGFQLEELQSFNEPPLVHCPNCDKDTLDRILGGGAGLIFKGSGFYLTDYKKASVNPDSKPEPKKKDEKQDGKKSDSPTPPPSSDSKPSTDPKPPPPPAKKD